MQPFDHFWRNFVWWGKLASESDRQPRIWKSKMADGGDFDNDNCNLQNHFVDFEEILHNDTH